MMQVAIDIDENLYTRLFNNGDIDAADMLKACAAIRKGIPIPKGHGKIIDVDAVSLDDIGFFSISDYQKMVHKLTTSCQTIIEADKEVEDAVSN